MTEEIGTLKIGEFHPSAHIAMAYMQSLGVELLDWLDVFSSCALADNRHAEICYETLRRVMNNEPVSDRYLMGLALYIMETRGEIIARGQIVKKKRSRKCKKQLPQC